MGASELGTSGSNARRAASHTLVRLALFVGFGIATIGCGARLASPMTANELVREPSGDALVHYLAQPDASPSVCDPLSSTPHVRRLDEDASEELVAALVDGVVEPAIWGNCVERMVANGPARTWVRSSSSWPKPYRGVLTSGAVERDPVVQSRLSVMHAI